MTLLELVKYLRVSVLDDTGGYGVDWQDVSEEEPSDETYGEPPEWLPNISEQEEQPSVENLIILGQDKNLTESQQQLLGFVMITKLSLF